MDNQAKKVIEIFTRYFIILLVGMGNLYIFYKFLTPLTIRAVAAVLDIFSEPFVMGNIIFFKKVVIEIVPACVAGSAFYLLFLLVVSTSDIKTEKRVLVLITSFSILFFLNTLRLVLLVPLAGAPYFQTVHWVFWHLISTVFVIAVWISMVYIYNLKEIPVYSDVKFLLSLSKNKAKVIARKKITKKSKKKRR